MIARRFALWGLSAYIAFVFVQSLFFKFTGSVESIFIFSTLRAWSGIDLFEPAGRWIIGICELIASVLLFLPRTRIFGAAMAIGIMTGAISFHLFTPLGVEILGDGGELFILACGVWISGWIILALSADEIRMWTGTALNIFGAQPAA
ncbi:MAG: DoxX family protein [Proteobacteria bacterium]|nr:DoxX family protein [Pseudomonadota bacterium]